MSTTPTIERTVPPWAAGTETRLHELNPELTDAQIEIVRGYGNEVSFEAGDWLWRTGERDAGFFLVLDGEVEIVNSRSEQECIIITHGRGHYGGETVTMTGRGALVGGRAKGAVKAIALSPRRLREMIALEAELGEMILLSFILRRMRMIAEVQGDVTLLGVDTESASAHLHSFLSRHGIPHEFRDVRATDTAEALAKAQVTADDRPVVVTNRGVLVRPSIRQLAEHLEIAAHVDENARFDVAVLGGGPAGLAAAVYGASEGLSVIVIDNFAPGGQAATSSRIENFFGFPTGISGQALTGRGFLQAQKFGAEMAVARSIEKLQCGTPHRLTLDGGTDLSADTVIIASGAVYRKPPIDGLDKFTGGGVHYGASFIEAQLCKQRDVAIVGGGNSAGQAAVFLSGFARCVRIIIRGADLTSSMSKYLIDRIERTRNIEVVDRTEVVEAVGETQLQSLVLRNNETGETRPIDTPHLFIFIGAVPATDFLPQEIALDDRGFVLTGAAIPRDALNKAGWAPERAPFQLETSVPGIFAAGDVRSGSVKRVASAVGEGSVSIQFVHQVLAERN